MSGSYAVNSNRHAIIFASLEKAHPGNHGMDVARWGSLCTLQASLKDSRAHFDHERDNYSFTIDKQSSFNRVPLVCAALPTILPPR